MSSKNKKQIIGITGTLGAGKGTIVDYLIKNKNFKHLSVRKFLTKEIKKRGLPVNRDSLVEVGNDLRTKNSPSYLAEQLYQEALNSQKNCIIESLRTPGEIKALKAKGNFYLLAVDADPKLRYERIISRNSSTDNLSFAEFIADETREMNSTNPNKQNLSACIKMADFMLDNSKGFNNLYDQIEAVLKKINN